jgi:hypothetical protein
MKIVASLLPVLLAGGTISVVAGGAAAAADFSGTWSASAVYEQNGRIVYTTTPVCTFQQSGSRISGTCKGPNALGPAAGTANGATISWQWEATANATGQTGVSTWNGTLGPDGVIRGQMSGAAMPSVTAPFTAQRQ